MIDREARSDIPFGYLMSLLDARSQDHPVGAAPGARPVGGLGPVAVRCRARRPGGFHGGRGKGAYGAGAVRGQHTRSTRRAPSDPAIWPVVTLRAEQTHRLAEKDLPCSICKPRA